jgi:hypothetical protein
MKRLTCLTLALLVAFAASAGWVSSPLDVTVPTPTVATAVALTGAVTVVAAPAAGSSYYLDTVSLGTLLPLPALTHTVATTSTVTSVAAPPSGQSYVLNLLATSTRLPANPTNCVTVAVDGSTYLMGNTTNSVVATNTVTSASTITVTLSATVTNRPTLTFYRVWSPDTNTYALQLVRNATTNSYAFTNGSLTRTVGLWVTNGTSITATRSDTVTNLPAVTFALIASPTTVTRPLAAGDQWNLYGARLASTIAPDGAGENTLAASVVYSGGRAVSYATFTNGAAGTTSDAPTRLLPGDTISIVATGATNSPVVRFPREIWRD